MRIVIASVVLGSVAIFSAGCDVRVHPATVAVEGPSVDVEGPPLVEGAGVEVVTDEPPITAREYVYEPGYPPGVYLYGGFYYYGGHRYNHDVFINKVVSVNVREHKYTNVEENRKAGQRIVEKHREAYQKTGGKRAPEKHVAEKHAPEKHVAEKHVAEKPAPEKHATEHHAAEPRATEHHPVEKHTTPGRPPEKPVNPKATHHDEK